MIKFKIHYFEVTDFTRNINRIGSKNVETCYRLDQILFVRIPAEITRQKPHGWRSRQRPRWNVNPSTLPVSSSFPIDVSAFKEMTKKNIRGNPIKLQMIRPQIFYSIYARLHCQYISHQCCWLIVLISSSLTF